MPFALVLSACQSMTGFELRIVASPDLAGVPAGAQLKVRDETRLTAVPDEVAVSEVVSPTGGMMLEDLTCLTTADGCGFGSRGGGWEPDPVDGVFVVRAWIDLAADDTFDWDADAPMPDYLPDAEDPQGVVLIPIVPGEIADAVLELAPPE
jgi:hypothetical protein